MSTEVAESPTAATGTRRAAQPRPPRDFDRPRFLKVYMGLFFIVLGVLSVLIATLSTVGMFLRQRTASLAEIQLRLAALEELLTRKAQE